MQFLLISTKLVLALRTGLHLNVSTWIRKNIPLIYKVDDIKTNLKRNAISFFSHSSPILKFYTDLVLFLNPMPYLIKTELVEQWKQKWPNFVWVRFSKFTQIMDCCSDIYFFDGIITASSSATRLDQLKIQFDIVTSYVLPQNNGMSYLLRSLDLRGLT